jgi:hypothetical protein
MTDITASRRTFLVIVGGLFSATVAGGLAIAASPGSCLAPDSIHTAIAAHVAAANAVDIAMADVELNDAVFDIAAAERALNGGRTLEKQLAVSNKAYRAFRVSIVASMTVAQTVPTTEAGHQALADHMQVDRYRKEVENGRRLNDHAARTGERFTVVDAV